MSTLSNSAEARVRQTNAVEMAGDYWVAVLLEAIGLIVAVACLAGGAYLWAQSTGTVEGTLAGAIVGVPGALLGLVVWALGQLARNTRATALLLAQAVDSQ